MLGLGLLLLAASPTVPAPHAAHHPHRTVYHGRVARRSHRQIALQSARLDVTGPMSTRSAYRLPFSTSSGPEAKDIAFAEDGSRCAVIGQTLCPRRTHVLMRMGDDGPAALPRAPR